MIFHCDALLPTSQRYASLKFRRYSRWFRPSRLAWDEALELIAFVETVGLKHARIVFHWTGNASVRAYRLLRKHVGDEAQPWIDANLASLGEDDGLAVFLAMKDGGWTQGSVPKIVRMAVQASPDAFSRHMTPSQVLWNLQRAVKRSRGRSIAALGVSNSFSRKI